MSQNNIRHNVFWNICPPTFHPTQQNKVSDVGKWIRYKVILLPINQRYYISILSHFIPNSFLVCLGFVLPWSLLRYSDDCLAVKMNRTLRQGVGRSWPWLSIPSFFPFIRWSSFVSTQTKEDTMRNHTRKKIKLTREKAPVWTRLDLRSEMKASNRFGVQIWWDMSQVHSPNSYTFCSYYCLWYGHHRKHGQGFNRSRCRCKFLIDPVPVFSRCRFHADDSRI